MITLFKKIILRVEN